MRFYIETYGCTSNQGNSQDLARALQEMGHSLAPLNEADAVIVNTCAVTEKTERKILRRLSLLQGRRLIIGGCLPAAIPESMSQIKCLGSLGLLGRSAAARVEDIFNARDDFQKRALPMTELGPGNDPCVVVNVAEGCNGSCTYCIVRTARGELRSRGVEEVAREVQMLVAKGAVEVPLRRSRSSFRMRLRWANSISTFFRSRREVT